MKYRLIVVGKSTDWVDQAVAQYVKRMPNLSVEQIAGNPVKSRTRRMFSACGERAMRICLDKSGRTYTSESLAKQCLTWQMARRDVCLLIGDDVGFNSYDLSKADLIWSLSPLTFPHHIARILVCEQLYRAYSINAGHDYHRT